MDKKKPPQESAAGSSDVFKLWKARPSRIPRVTKETIHQGDPKVDWKLFSIIVGVITAIVAAAFVNSLWWPAVFNDNFSLDFIAKVTNWDAFWSGLWAQAAAMPFSQPWLRATYAYDFQSAGFNLMWYHFVNICLHLLACIYLFALLFRIAFRLRNEGRLTVNPYYLAGFAACLFACHPLTAEGVAYISGRQAPLMTATYLLTLNLFLAGYLAKGKGVRFWGYTLSLAFLVNALFISPDALTLPLSAIVIAILLKDPDQDWLGFVSEKLFILASLVLLFGTLPYLILKGMVLQVGSGLGLPIPEPAIYFASQFKELITYYLRCFLVPVGLTVDPPYAIATGFSDPLAILGVLVFVAAIAGLFILRSNAIVVLGLYFFLIGFVPSCFIVQPEIVSDHRFYFSLMGLCIIAGWGMAKLANKSLVKAGIAGGAIIACMIGLTIWHNMIWSSDMHLWKSVLKTNQDSARAHAMLALLYTHENKMTDAAKEAKKALQIDPRIAPAFIAVGGVLLHEKDYAGARDAFSHAIELAEKQHLPKELLVSSRSGLAESYLQEGQAPQAFANAQIALQQDPDNARLYFIIGKCYYLAKQYQSAISQLQTALQHDASLYECWPVMAQSAIEGGMPDVAYGAANMVNLHDKSSASKILLAKADLLSGRYDESQSVLQPVVQDEPKNAEALILLSYTENKLGNNQAARKYRAQALDIDAQIQDKVKMPSMPDKSKPAEAQTGAPEENLPRKHRRHHRG
jgi:tetratricopeptide (TPR) repeat protein